MTMNRCAFKPMQFVTRWVFAAGAVLLLACNSEPSTSTSPRLSAPLAARATGDVVVSATSPDSASQDTTLDVTISGSGFASGSVAQWALAAVADPAQVRTNSTRFVNSRTLVANITISAAATTGKWDVVVTSGSKGGIGTELFTVKPKGNVDTDSRVNYIVSNQVDIGGTLRPAGIIGDGRLRDGSSAAGGDSEYQGQFCGTGGSIANGVRENGDLSYDPDNGSTFCGTPRYYMFALDGVPTQLAPLSRVFGIWSIGVGQVVNKGQGFGVGLTNCAVLMFNSQYGGDDLKVTRLDTGTGPRRWRVESQGAHMAACVVQAKKGALTYVATGKKYYLPFLIMVTEVPYPYPSL